MLQESVKMVLFKGNLDLKKESLDNKFKWLFENNREYNKIKRSIFSFLDELTLVKTSNISTKTLVDTSVISKKWLPYAISIYVRVKEKNKWLSFVKSINSNLETIKDFKKYIENSCNNMEISSLYENINDNYYYKYEGINQLNNICTQILNEYKFRLGGKNFVVKHIDEKIDMLGKKVDMLEKNGAINDANLKQKNSDLLFKVRKVIEKKTKLKNQLDETALRFNWSGKLRYQYPTEKYVHQCISANVPYKTIEQFKDAIKMKINRSSKVMGDKDRDGNRYCKLDILNVEDFKKNGKAKVAIKLIPKVLHMRKNAFLSKHYFIDQTKFNHPSNAKVKLINLVSNSIKQNEVLFSDIKNNKEFSLIFDKTPKDIVKMLAWVDLDVLIAHCYRETILNWYDSSTKIIQYAISSILNIEQTNNNYVFQLILMRNKGEEKHEPGYFEEVSIKKTKSLIVSENIYSVGIDLNSGFFSAAICNKSGVVLNDNNEPLIKEFEWKYPCFDEDNNLKGTILDQKNLTSSQQDTIINYWVKQILQWVKQSIGDNKFVICIENLDFSSKKMRVKKNSKEKNYNHMLHSLPYSKVKESFLKHTCIQKIPCLILSPAYSSVGGYVLYGQKLKISADQAAAIWLGHIIFKENAFLVQNKGGRLNEYLSKQWVVSEINPVPEQLKKVMAVKYQKNSEDIHWTDVKNYLGKNRIEWGDNLRLATEQIMF